MSAVKIGITPHDIATPKGGHFWGAFDNCETEISARWIVRFCQERGDWSPFTLADIEEFYNRGGYQNFRFNWLLDEHRGWLVIRDEGTERTYQVTNDFIYRCYKAAPVK